jgi:para-nitrobenzyl esterase
LFIALSALSGCSDDQASPSLDASMSPSAPADGASHSDAGAAADSGRSDAGASTGRNDDPSSLEIDDGVLKGSVDGKTRRFLGIPYAKPPLGDLRWKRPEKPAKWSAPRDATKFGKRCAQANSAGLMNPPSADEDCLSLNVWTPTDAKDLPVMVWIHGGGNVNGSASEIVPYAPLDSGLYFYDGKRLSEKGVVLVSINYRLGVFGFLSHPALDEQGKPSGNQGMWDQIAALEWVQSNIAKFGGDPKNVTIFGESAGSLDVCAHVASPKSRGLFHKAISQSGGCTTITATKEQAFATSKGLAEAVGCAGGDELSCLRGKDVATLLAPAATLPGVAAARTLGPSVDGDFLPEQPRTLFRDGRINKVPYMLGSNRDEGTLFTVSSPQISTEEQYDAALQMQYMAGAAAVKAVYSLDKFAGQRPNPAQAALTRIVGDSRLVCTTSDSALLAAPHVPAVYTYNFDIPVSESLNPNVYLGATHGAELVYVFQTSPNFTPEQTAVSELMQNYWVHFARTGDPNGAGRPEWPKYAAGSDRRMNFAVAQSAVVQEFRKQECDLWIGFYERTFTSATAAPSP